MRPRINLSLQVAAGILALIAPCFLAAQGAPAVSLEEQLSAQYTLVKMGSDSSGPAVVEPGTILAIQKGGIRMEPSILRLQRPAIRPLAWGRKCVACSANATAQKSRSGNRQQPACFRSEKRCTPQKLRFTPTRI